MTSLPYDLTRSVYHRVKRIIGASQGQNHDLAPEVRLKKKRFGTFYGGWVIASSALPKRDPLVYSFGLGEDISFDLEMIETYGAIVHGFDPTPTQVDWGKQRNLPDTFHFHPIGLAGRDGTVSFGAPTAIGQDDFTMLRGETEGAVKLPVARLATLMSELGHQHVDIVKMDIEGAEYEAIADIVKTQARPTQLLIEFHYIGIPGGLDLVRTSVEQLRDAGYKLFDVAPLGREISFIHESALRSP